MTFDISDLRQRPEFFETVADRTWREWWEDRGVPRSFIADRLTESLTTAAIPATLVACDGGVFLGASALIVSDVKERPEYTPWVAAVWVEPDRRGEGIGRTLVARAVDAGFALGYDKIYLCAAPFRRSYYVSLGWTPIEEHVGPRDLTVFMQERPTLDVAGAP